MPKEKIGFLIKQVHILQEQRLNKKFSRFDLTGAQMFTLINLLKAKKRGEKLTQRDLEHILDISNPTVTGILNRLEAKGLITRVCCREDGRKKVIEVSEKAEGLYDAIRKTFEESEQELLSALKEEEIIQLHEYLERILRSHS